MELLQKQRVKNNNERILKLVLDEEELSWQQIIYDLVRSEQMDPWDINLGQLTGKFLEVITKLKELDFRVSGKIVVASAVLLKMKSDRLLDEDIMALDALIADSQDDEMEYFEEELQELRAPEKPPKIYPRTPQPRQRKVSVYDLVTALEKALVVSVRREKRALDTVEIEEVTVPEQEIDVTDAMNSLLKRISAGHKAQEKLTFRTFVPEDTKRAHVYTFIPLLHLTNERRLDLEQPEHFGDINIKLLSDAPLVRLADS